MQNLIKKTLQNGLRVLVYQDKSAQMCCVDIVYKVGARNENPNQTGLAHLLEHLMFGGTERFPDFDTLVQAAGGESNAYTSNDVTHYYLNLPPENIELAFQLESDRMANPPSSESLLQIQKQVVIEEFKETSLNQPYGDLWELIRTMTYGEHSYGWCTIGKEIAHIESVTLSDVQKFFENFYRPDNAVLVVSGNIDPEKVWALAAQYFENITVKKSAKTTTEETFTQVHEKFLMVERDVPFDLIYKAYPMCKRMDNNYFAYDLLSDILGGGRSSRLYQHLVVEKAYCSDANAFITGSFDEGLLLITARPNPGIDLQQIDDEIQNLLTSIDLISDYELQKVKNKVETSLLFADLRLQEKSSAIALAETLSSAEFLDEERALYFQVTSEDVLKLLKCQLTEKQASTLYYKGINQNFS